MESKPLIINFTPTGMMPTKVMTPHVPVSPAEIIDEVLSATDLGITMVHLHARDCSGTPTSDQDVYARIIEGIRRYAPIWLSVPALVAGIVRILKAGRRCSGLMDHPSRTWAV